MLKKRGHNLPLVFIGDAVIVFGSFWIHYNNSVVNSVFRKFLLQIIFAIACFAWNWFMSIPEYVTFRVTTGDTHLCLDAFWVLRFASSLLWSAGIIRALLRLELLNFVIALTDASGSAILILYALKKMKSSSEDRLCRRRVAIL